MNARWDRLMVTLAEYGPRLSTRNFPGGISYSITIEAGPVDIEVGDAWWRKNADLWIGYQVVVIDRASSLIKRDFPITKKRSEVAENVSASLSGAA